MDSSEKRNTTDNSGRFSSGGRESVSYTGRHETIADSNSGRLSQTGNRKSPAVQQPYVQDTQKLSGYTGRHQSIGQTSDSNPEQPKVKKSEKENHSGLNRSATEAVTGFENKASSSKGSKTKYYLFAMLIIIVLIIATSIVLRSLSSKSEYLEYYNTALEDYYEKDYEAALTNLRSAAEIENTEECIVLMSECYERMGNYDKAIETLRLLDIGDEDVRARIADLQSKIDTQTTDGKVQVCGNYYSTSTSELVLKGMGITDSQLNEVIQLYALTSLNISDNSLSDIRTLASLGGLTTLDLSGNSIYSLSGLESLTGLRVLYLDDNPISDFSPLYSLTNLATLSIKGIGISSEQLAALSAALPSCAIHSEETTQTVAELSIAGITFKSEVTELDLSGLGISDISVLSKCRYLTKLNLSSNSIMDISCLMDLPNLKWLDISSNSISDIRPLMSLTSVTYLNASNNLISSVAAVGRLQLLQTLDLSSNSLSDISAIGKLKKLTTLNLAGTSLEDEMLIYLLDCKALAALDIRENPALTGEAVQGFISASGGCAVEHDDLAFSVSIGGNLYKDDITQLNLAGSGVTDVSPIALFKQLEWLNLEGNAISNIYNLSNMSTLKYLDLSDNNIEDITPISGLTELEQLDLSNNPGISSITQFMGLTKLVELNLTGTSISQENISVLASNLPLCHISY